MSPAEMVEKSTTREMQRRSGESGLIGKSRSIIRAAFLVRREYAETILPVTSHVGTLPFRAYYMKNLVLCGFNTKVRDGTTFMYEPETQNFPMKREYSSISGKPLIIEMNRRIERCRIVSPRTPSLRRERKRQVLTARSSDSENFSSFK